MSPLNDRYLRASVGRRRGRRSPWEVRWPCPGAHCQHCRPGDRIAGLYHTRSFPNRELAEAFRRRVQTALDDSVRGVRRVTWADAVARYDDHTAMLSAKHRWSIHRALRCLTRFCRPIMLDDVTADQCERYFGALGRGEIPERRATASEYAKERRVLHAFFSWAGPPPKGHGWLESNPVRMVPALRPPQPIPDVPTDDAVLRLLATLSDPPRLAPLEQRLAALGAIDATAPNLDRLDRQAWYVYVLLAAYTGIDQMDLLRITLARRPRGSAYTIELNLDDGPAGIIWGRRMKTGKPAPHGLPPAVNDLVALRVADLPAGTTMLLPWRSFPRKQWLDLCRAAGFGHTFKALRRYHATASGEAAALAAASKELGHARTEVTRGHYYPDERRTLAAALARRVPTKFPPLPRYGPPDLRSTRGRRPRGNE